MELPSGSVGNEGIFTILRATFGSEPPLSWGEATIGNKINNASQRLPDVWDVVFSLPV
jgi:hypothetical protein